MLILLSLLVIVAVWFASSSMRKKGQLSANAQRIMMGVVIVIAIGVALYGSSARHTS